MGNAEGLVKANLLIFMNGQKHFICWALIRFTGSIRVREIRVNEIRITDFRVKANQG